MFGFGFQYGKVLGLSLGALLASVFRKRVVADGGTMEGEGCVTSELNRLNKIGILDDVSLAMIPSGYKASKLYSVVPSDGSGDLSFSRSTTGTRVNADGLIESVAINEPRLDFTGGGCGKYLFEPQRINLITYSEDFSNAYWTKSGATVVSGQTSPSADSPTGAFKLLEDTSNGSHEITPSVPVSNGETYTLSAYFKSSDRNIAIAFAGTRMASGNGGSGADNYSIVNLLDGSILVNFNQVKVIDLLNGYYRVSNTFTVGTSGGSFDILIKIANGTSRSYTGNGTSGVDIFAAQLESGSYATSYTPTVGSTVTRTADSSSTSGLSSVINSVEGVLYFEIQWDMSSGGSNRRISLSDGTTSNRILIQNVSVNANVLQFYVINSSGVSTDFAVTLDDITANNKIAFKYKLNDFCVFVNGVKVLTDTSGTTFTANTLNRFGFDGGSGNFPFYGKVKGLGIFNILTDTQMAALTTI